MMKPNRTFTVGDVQFDLRLTFLVIIATIIPMLDRYNYRFTSIKAYDRMIYYFIIPMVVILLVFRERPSDFGWQWGNWKIGLMWTAVAAAGMAIILWFLARTPAMQQYYEVRSNQDVLKNIYFTGVDLFGWEFMWRGFLLFALARILGPGPAILIQAIPFAFMHLGKPQVETLSTIFGGIGFGFVAWQSKSFVYPWFIHWFIATFTKLIALGQI